LGNGEEGKASNPVYLDRARIFRRLRFSLRIRFLRHLALMIKLKKSGFLTAKIEMAASKTLRAHKSFFHS
jgi:hypothetical protein